MLNLKSGKHFTDAPTMTRGGFLKGILASGIAPSITLATIANAGSANASVGGMMRNVGARNAAMFGGEKEKQKYYTFNAYTSTFKDENGIIGPYTVYDARDYVIYPSIIQWSNFDTFEIVVRTYLCGLGKATNGSASIITREYDSEFKEVGAPHLAIVRRTDRNGGINWNPVSSSGEWASTIELDNVWVNKAWNWFKYKFTGTVYQLEHKLDDGEWRVFSSFSNARKPNNSHLWFGSYGHNDSNPNTMYTGDYIDMNNTYIIADGVEWWRGRC